VRIWDQNIKVSEVLRYKWCARPCKKISKQHNQELVVWFFNSLTHMKVKIVQGMRTNRGCLSRVIRMLCISSSKDWRMNGMSSLASNRWETLLRPFWEMNRSWSWGATWTWISKGDVKEVSSSKLGQYEQPKEWLKQIQVVKWMSFIWKYLQSGGVTQAAAPPKYHYPLLVFFLYLWATSKETTVISHGSRKVVVYSNCVYFQEEKLTSLVSVISPVWCIICL
jgi:hypothetical protein